MFSSASSRWRWASRSACRSRFVCLRRPALRATALAITSIVQTIPGLALLALFYPLLLALAALTERAFGFSFSALGLLPSVLALTLYSMLPVLRNTITGLDGDRSRRSRRPRSASA